MNSATCVYQFEFRYLRIFRVCVYQEWRSDNGIWHQVMENFEILFKHIAMNHWRTFFAQSTHHAIFILLRLNHTYEPFILNVYQ